MEDIAAEIGKLADHATLFRELEGLMV